jgi:hypothetical protein
MPSMVALVLAAVIGGSSAIPAGAQEYEGNRGREMQRNHDNRHDNRRESRQGDRGRYDSRSYARPAYIYSPPPVYYAPPPPPPVVDLVFPFRFN